MVPPLGFENKPSIVWLYGSTAKFATASTCDVQLRLPTCHGEDYAAFKEALIMSLKDNDGFGGEVFVFTWFIFIIILVELFKCVDLK